MAAGAMVAPALGKDASRTRPPRRPAMASSSASASARRARMTSVWRTSASPACVRRTPRALRSTRGMPASRSSAAICWETADCVKCSASAAAEKEPRAATSRSTFKRRTSSITRTYSTLDERSFELIAPVAENALTNRSSPRTPHMTDITIRTAAPTDVDALHRLAALDSQRLPAGDLLVAEVGGNVVAAYQPESARAIADPFLPTANAIDLLRLRAGEAARETLRDRRSLLGSRPRLA